MNLKTLLTEPQDIRDCRDDKLFNKYILKDFAKEFFLGNNFQEFAKKIQSKYKLSSGQWDFVLQNWETKEILLAD